MGTVLKIITRFAAMLGKRFRRAKPAPAVNPHEEMLKTIIKAENAIYKSIKIQLQNDPHIEKYGVEVRLLHRRLAQYERMRSHASLADQGMALRKLEKQWKKVSLRRTHGHAVIEPVEITDEGNRNPKDNSCDERSAA